MRRVINPQLQFGEQDISAIELDLKSRDDIPQILRGLQYIYVTPEIRDRVFEILVDVIPTRRQEDGTEVKADPQAGRPGMDQLSTCLRFIAFHNSPPALVFQPRRCKGGTHRES